MSDFEIEIDDNDAINVLGRSEYNSLKTSNPERVLGEEADKSDKLQDKILDIALGSLVSKIPESFEVVDITISVKLSGKILGSGIEGSSIVKVRPK